MCLNLECYSIVFQSNTAISSYWAAMGCILNAAYFINVFRHSKANEIYKIVTKQCIKYSQKNNIDGDD